MSFLFCFLNLAIFITDEIIVPHVIKTITTAFTLRSGAHASVSSLHSLPFSTTLRGSPITLHVRPSLLHHTHNSPYFQLSRARILSSIFSKRPHGPLELIFGCCFRFLSTCRASSTIPGFTTNLQHYFYPVSPAGVYLTQGS